MNQQLSHVGGADAFVARLSAAGETVWSTTVAGPAGEAIGSVGLAADGSTFLAGAFTMTTQVGGHSLSSVGGADLMVVKLDQNGKVGWSASGGGSLDDGASHLTLDAHGNPVIVGGFGGVATLGDDMLVSAGETDGFVARLDDASGQFAWSSRFGGTLFETTNGTCTLPSGRIATLGSFEGIADFGGQQAMSAGGSDVFLLETIP